MVNVPNRLSKALNDAVIRRLAGAQSYQRALDYFSHGHVESIEARLGSIHAVVRGNQVSTVTLTADEGIAGRQPSWQSATHLATEASLQKSIGTFWRVA